MTPLPKNARVCVMSARRYGDAIMNAVALKEAAQVRPDIEWIIWTKPEFAPLFRLMGFHRIITAQFPIAGGVPRVLQGGWLSLLKSITQLHKLQVDASIDFIGDARESFLGMLISGRRHHSPRWEGQAPPHWMKRLIWNYSLPWVKYIPVASDNGWAYQFVTLLISNVLGCNIEAKGSSLPLSSPLRIAFHPYSSQAFKQWPTENWLMLAKILADKGVQTSILCSPAELALANTQFGHAAYSIPIFSNESIEKLASEVNKIDLLIGVDSFLVHLASALGKRTIVINAGNLPQWWAPPNSIAIGQSGGCPHYPCSNEPTCLGQTHEAICIRSISPEQVLNAISLDLVTHSSTP
ncbi:glycosyltransferase family 9 protein [Polynucleobacter sp. MG-5-Ahmo-C2]|uniref:glycosyltransferase family 9 protein n=1 Tax=Polynucleobacter sp. MG-5-Ahmo-C2 TaxID=2081051 RepID=UPI001BFE2182|nr:glycosyltransferase family 9 protein [Polynucleobacter sp. MG-5-Ahmo-C2]